MKNLKQIKLMNELLVFLNRIILIKSKIENNWALNFFSTFFKLRERQNFAIHYFRGFSNMRSGIKYKKNILTWPPANTTHWKDFKHGCISVLSFCCLFLFFCSCQSEGEPKGITDGALRDTTCHLRVNRRLKALV